MCDPATVGSGKRLPWRWAASYRASGTDEQVMALSRRKLGRGGALAYPHVGVFGMARDPQEFVAAMRARGHTDEHITDRLLAAGWSEAQASGLLQLVPPPSDSVPQALGTSTCAYCHSPIKGSDRSVSCPTCGTPHHSDCWHENRGCAVFGCGGQQSRGPVEAAGPEYAPVRARTTRFDNIHDAAHFGEMADVRLFLASGVSLEAVDQSRQTPLHRAASGGMVDVAAFLLDAGANPDAREKEGQTPLHYAACLGYAEMAEVLLRRRADVDATDKEEHTPLHVAAQMSYVQVAEVLLRHGASINARDKDGWTPLWWATKDNPTETASLLRRRGGIA